MPKIGFFELLIWIVLIAGIALISVKWVQWVRERRELERIKKSGIQDVDRMSEIEFETFVKMLFSEVGFSSKGMEQSESGFGADFLLDGPTKAVLKLMRSGPNTRIGLKAVQEIHTARTYFDAREAWLITNTVFTDNAKKMAEKCNVKLIDRFLLQKLILTVNPEVDAKEVRENIQRLFQESFWAKEQGRPVEEGRFEKVQSE